ncbi:reverse transcriptase [Trichonephila clavipes]|nr:reverse transcriptase [Trichonephila clavipes]
MASNKADVSANELNSCAFETIEQRYPVNEWLHIYTDGSYLPETKGAGVRWFCWLFEGSLARGKKTSPTIMVRSSLSVKLQSNN